MTSAVVIAIIFVGLFVSLAVAQPGIQPAANPAAEGPHGKIYTYKKTAQGELKMEVFFPGDWKASDRRAGIVFFFGGGWVDGRPGQFYRQCEYLASRGIVAATADYRVKNRHQVTPDKCVEDAKSAVRWMKGHAGELGIDPERVMAGGGSAGGHLAAAVAFCPGLDGPDDDLTISVRPAALVLFNPVLNTLIAPAIDRMPGETAEEKTQAAEAVSPNRYVGAGAPPMIMFFGSADRLSATGDEYLILAEKFHNRAELYVAADQPHGFFNRPQWKEAALVKVDEFLQSLGYLKGPATTTAPAEAPLTKAIVGQAVYRATTQPAVPD